MSVEVKTPQMDPGVTENPVESMSVDVEIEVDAKVEEKTMESMSVVMETSREAKNAKKAQPSGPAWIDILDDESEANLMTELQKIGKLVSHADRRKDCRSHFVSHQLSVYPMDPEDMVSRDIIKIMESCSTSRVAFHNVREFGGNIQLKGLLQLNFDKLSALEASKETLAKLKPNIKLNHRTDTSGKNKSLDSDTFHKGWAACINATENKNVDNALILFAPSLRETVTEDDLWDMFPNAQEIVLVSGIPKHHAYITFGSEIMLNDSIAMLKERGPLREDFNFCRLIRFSKVIAINEKMKKNTPTKGATRADDKNNASASRPGTANATSNRQKKKKAKKANNPNFPQESPSATQRQDQKSVANVKQPANKQQAKQAATANQPGQRAKQNTQSPGQAGQAGHAAQSPAQSKNQRKKTQQQQQRQGQQQPAYQSSRPATNNNARSGSQSQKTAAKRLERAKMFRTRDQTRNPPFEMREQNLELLGTLLSTLQSVSGSYQDAGDSYRGGRQSRQSYQQQPANSYQNQGYQGNQQGANRNNQSAQKRTSSLDLSSVQSGSGGGKNRNKKKRRISEPFVPDSTMSANYSDYGQSYNTGAGQSSYTSPSYTSPSFNNSSYYSASAVSNMGDTFSRLSRQLGQSPLQRRSTDSYGYQGAQYSQYSYPN